MDTAGQEEFDSIRTLAYDNVDILVMALSVVNQDSFDNIKKFWCKEVEKEKNKFKDTKVRWRTCVEYDMSRDLFQIVLIGTKADLATVPSGSEAAADAPVTRDMGESLAREIKAVGYVETSAKTGEGVKEAVEMGLKAVRDKGASPKPFCICQ